MKNLNNLFDNLDQEEQANNLLEDLETEHTVETAPSWLRGLANLIIGKGWYKQTQLED